MQIAGDFIKKDVQQHIAGMVGAGQIDMKKGKDGTWTYTSNPLPSELYSYTFLVDGVPVLDPNNPHVYRDFATVTNVFIVGGGLADLFKVNDVPHGTLVAKWYHSYGIGKDRRLNTTQIPTSSIPYFICSTVPAVTRTSGPSSAVPSRSWTT